MAANSPVNKKPAVPLAPGIATQLRNYVELMRLNKPIGIWLLLWPTLWALWLAGDGRPDQGLFVVFVLGVFMAVEGAGMPGPEQVSYIEEGGEPGRVPILVGVILAVFAAILLTSLGCASLGPQDPGYAPVVPAGAARASARA